MIAVLIVAAGNGTRCKGCGQILPKQYAFCQGKPILRLTVEKFLANPLVSNIQVVINEDHYDFYYSAIGDLKILDPVIGGSTRTKSVYYGLKSLKSLNPHFVLIHDAVRPFVRRKLTDDVISILKTKQCAAIPSLSISDTVKIISENNVTTINRSHAYILQTPQGFIFEDILTCYEINGDEDFTDDSTLLEKYGKPIAYIKGHVDNIKITTQEDLHQIQERYGSRYN